MARAVCKWTRKRRSNHNSFGNQDKKPSAAVVVEGGENVGYGLDESASSKKICDVSLSSLSDNPVDKASSGYRLISLELLNAAVRSVSVCGVCKIGTLTVNEDLRARKGWASKLFFTCNNVDCKTSEPFYTSNTVVDSGTFEINHRLTYAMRCIGKGRASANVVSAVLNVPPPVKNFQRYNKPLHLAAREVCLNSMKRAAEESKSKNNNDPNITVTGDGSWMCRGHTSKFGTTTVISTNNGKVVDTEVSSKYCHSCVLHSKMDKKSDKYLIWESSHNDVCKANYSGTSGGMEVSGALAIFHRSEERNGLRYTKYISDGDSRAFKAVQEAKPYGVGVEMEKLECIGHVQKRMGSRLRNLRQAMKGKRLSDNKLLSGKGRLTDKHIDTLQYYYGAAIRSNVGDLDRMRQAVWATFLHKASTDSKPQHQLCPKENGTWCKYNQSLLTNTPYVHTNSLPEAIIETIKPTYKSLADKELLKKCLHGMTQNANESLNGLIWDRCPKVKWAGKDTVEIATWDAVSYFNDGNTNKMRVLEQLGVEAGVWCVSGLGELDEQRISQSNSRTEASSKEARVKKRQRTRAQTDKEKEKDYVAGGH